MSHKNLDKNGRLRSVIVSFRVSPEENKIINNLVKVSGMTKQDYIINRLENRELTVIPNPKVYIGLKNLIIEMTETLKKTNNVSDEIIETIKLLANVINDMK